jgi:hypothetical protein
VMMSSLERLLGRYRVARQPQKKGEQGGSEARRN